MRIVILALVLGAVLCSTSAVSSPASSGLGVNDFVHYKSSLRIEHLTSAVDNRITFRYNVSRLTHDHQNVNVSWVGVYNPNTFHYIALYVGRGFIDPKLTLPVQFLRIADVCPSYLESGNGSAVFQLINMRGDYKFMLMVGLTHPIVMGVGPAILNDIWDAPTSGHLGLHSDQRSLVVQWTSGSSKGQAVQWWPHTGKDLAPPVASRRALCSALPSQGQGLRLGGSSSSGDRQVAKKHEPSPSSPSSPSTTSTYKAKDMCGYPASTVGFLDPGFMHSAVISHDLLQPNTRYTYRFGSKKVGWSAEHSFLSPPPPASPEPFTFLAFNDVCQGHAVAFNNPGGIAFVPYGENSLKLAPTLAANESGAQLALLIGDLAYAQGYAADWDYFGDQFESVFTQWPLVTAPGNHERDWPGTNDIFNDSALDSGGECNIPYHHRYYTPARAKYADPRRSYYSFDFASVHFLILDSETDSSADSEQGRFVAADLASVNRINTPWLMVAFHRMMYAPATDVRPLVGDLANEERFLHDYEDLFHQYKVDVVLSGHEHAYARTCQVYRHECASEGPIYLVAGHAGAGFTHGFPAKLPDFFTFGVQDENGYMRFVASGTTLNIEAISTDDGRVMDTVTLTKGEKPLYSVQ